MEPPPRSSQVLLDEKPDQWLGNRKLPSPNTQHPNIAKNLSLSKKNAEYDWPYEEEESPLPSPVVLANQVLKKVKLAPKRGWSEDSQPSFDEPEKPLPPVPPKRKNKALVTTEKV